MQHYFVANPCDILIGKHIGDVAEMFLPGYAFEVAADRKRTREQVPQPDARRTENMQNPILHRPSKSG